MTDTETMLKPREVASWLGVHVNTVKRMGERGDLPFYRIGRRGDRRYRPADIDAYLQQRSGSDGSPGRKPSHARGATKGK